MQRELWRVVLCAKDVLLDASTDPTTTLKAVHAITSASTAYAKLIEVGELEARLSTLEEERDKSMGNRKNGRAYA